MFQSGYRTAWYAQQCQAVAIQFAEKIDILTRS